MAVNGTYVWSIINAAHVFVEKASLLPDALAKGGVQGGGLVPSSQGATEALPRPSRGSGDRHGLTFSGPRTPNFSI